MKKIIVLLVSSILLFTTSCKNNTASKPKTADEIIEMASKAPGLNAGNKNYVLETPKDWTTRDTVIRNIKIHFLYPPKDEAAKGINVNIVNESMMGITFEEYLEKTEKSMKDYMPSFKLLEKGSFLNEGVKTMWTHYTAIYENLKLEGIVYITQNDGIAYIMTAITPEGSMDKYHSTFDRIAQSFKFKD